MKSETNQPNHDAEYAHQWINFLRQRNTALNIIWPIFLVISVISSVAAFYFYHMHSGSNNIINDLRDQLSEQTAQAQMLQEEMDGIKVNYELVQDENKFLKSDKAQLSAQQNDSESQLNISSKIVSTLEAQVRALKEEKETMSEAVLEAKALLLRQERQHKAQQDEAQNGLSLKNKQLSKQLKSRKVAYEALVKRQLDMQAEIDRLAGLVDSQSNQIAQGQRAAKTAQNKAKKERQEMSALRIRNKELEQQLKVLVSPISGTKKPNSAKADSGKLSASKSSKLDKSELNAGLVESGRQAGASSNVSSGLEEIKRPIKVKEEKKADKAVNAASFDYDQISVN